MTSWRPIRLILILPLFVAIFACCCAAGQDDPNETPLGDVARSLRKRNAAQEKVIDDDNLPQVMEQADKKREVGSALQFLMDKGEKGFEVSAPDVTCSLAFNANVKSLLSNQYAQMDLPASEIAKLSGRATIEGDALIVPVFNGTSWHVSELAVALTVVKKKNAGMRREDAESGPLHFGPATEESTFQAVRPEKRPDVTIIYRMRAAAAPLSQTAFSAPLELDLAADDEWHWAIVEARGYPPQSYAPNQAVQNKVPASLRPSAAVVVPQDQAAGAASQIPQ